MPIPRGCSGEGERSSGPVASLNKVMVIGNIGSDPEMRFTPSGSPVTSFRVATNRVYTTADGERRQETEWFTVVAWNRLAENCNQFLTKGQRIYAEGRLHLRTWESQDGEKRFRNEIVADKVTFLDRQTAAPLPQEGTEEAEEAESGELSPDEIPFS